MIICRSNGRTHVLIHTCLAVVVLYTLAVSLWMIDVHNIITEVNTTLLSSSTNTLDNKYTVAITNILRLDSIEDILHAFMVLMITFDLLNCND